MRNSANTVVVTNEVLGYHPEFHQWCLDRGLVITMPSGLCKIDGSKWPATVEDCYKRWTEEAYCLLYFSGPGKAQFLIGDFPDPSGEALMSVPETKHSGLIVLQLEWSVCDPNTDPTGLRRKKKFSGVKLLRKFARREKTLRLPEEARKAFGCLSVQPHWPRNKYDCRRIWRSIAAEYSVVMANGLFPSQAIETLHEMTWWDMPYTRAVTLVDERWVTMYEPNDAE